jgi:hypothetical protein
MKKVGILLIVLAVVVVAVSMGYNRFVARADERNAGYQTAAIQRGTLVATVNAAGAIQANAQTALTFQMTPTCNWP